MLDAAAGVRELHEAAEERRLPAAGGFGPLEGVEGVEGREEGGRRGEKEVAFREPLGGEEPRPGVAVEGRDEHFMYLNLRLNSLVLQFAGFIIRSKRDTNVLGF